MDVYVCICLYVCVYVCRVMGWGSAKPGGIGERLLHEVQIFVQPVSECSRVSSKVPKDWRSQMCAGDLKGGRDTCQGQLFHFTCTANFYALFEHSEC